MLEPEQTNHYYYYKYNKYNNNNRKKKACFSLVAMMRCDAINALCACIVMVAVFQNIPEHAGTLEHAWWFSLVPVWGAVAWCCCLVRIVPWAACVGAHRVGRGHVSILIQV